MEPMTSKAPLISTGEKPENGIRGLRHWRHDLLAGMQVSLVSLPLSLGIAIASGAPPVTGIVSAVIAGLVYPFIGGAYVTISGPAAGLAPALLGGMLVLGAGNLKEGYPLLLVAISLTGVVQLVLTYFRAGRFAIFFPQTVVEAMLAAIGIIIIIKQFPLLLGVIAPPLKTIPATLAALPGQISNLNTTILLIGAVSTFLIFFLNRTEIRWLRIIPPPLSVVVVGLAIGTFAGLDPKYLINIPGNLVESIQLPAFGTVLSRPDLWWTIATIVITLTLIDGIESLATIQAVDRIDPWQRKSEPNRTLGAMGLSNLFSSLVGGLTIIPGDAGRHPGVHRLAPLRAAGLPACRLDRHGPVSHLHCDGGGDPVDGPSRGNHHRRPAVRPDAAYPALAFTEALVDRPVEIRGDPASCLGQPEDALPGAGHEH
jgi:carbonic anhydrase